MDEYDEMKSAFNEFFREPNPGFLNDDSEWLMNFGIFVHGWDMHKAFQQRVQNDSATASENHGVSDNLPSV